MFFLAKFLRGKNITTPVFSATEKQNMAADARELMDNQIRTAACHINAIRCMIRDGAVLSYPELSELEYDFFDILAFRITDNLLQHFQIDLVRNHIVKKTDSELRDYAEGKAAGYYQKVKTYLDDYNRTLKKYDFSRLMDNIPEQSFIDLYLKAYSGAKKIASGY